MKVRLLGVLMLLCFGASLFAAEEVDKKKQAWTDPAKAAAEDWDFNIQGEYLGEVRGDEGPVTWGVHIIALGDGQFRAVSYRGGLPGAGWNRGDESAQSDGKREGDAAVFRGEALIGTVRDGAISVTNLDGLEVMTLRRTERTSPTLGKKPPPGAIVLFDGSGVDAFKPGAKMEDGLLLPGVTSNHRHGDATIHVEFLLPYMPHARGQGRGNSGLYMQGRYEAQMLDSFGLEGKDNECGGLYKISAPWVNACLPPLTWQTYDVEFTAARFNDKGEKTANAKMTVHLNGILVQKDVEVSNATTAAVGGREALTGPLHLQNHGNPVRFRNVWLIAK